MAICHIFQPFPVRLVLLASQIFIRVSCQAIPVTLNFTLELVRKGRDFVIGKRFRIARRRRRALAAAMTGAARLGTTLLAAAPARASSADCAS